MSHKWKSRLLQRMEDLASMLKRNDNLILLTDSGES